MRTRYTGTITALLLTAALFLCVPGLWRMAQTGDANRMDVRLRPPRMHTLTVWLLGDETEDRKLILQACTAFEKAQRGVRVFLRRADAQDLTAPDAVVPDVALFETGGVNMPEKVFVPLADAAESSGMFAGVSYAVPLWLSPNVLCFAQGWFSEDGNAETYGESLLASSTPKPQQSRRILEAQELPWTRLVQAGALKKPQGVALEQLLCMCPYPLRQQLSASAAASAQGAEVRTLAQAMRDPQAAVCVMTPAVSDRVRYAALCRDGEDARAFVAFLQDQMGAEALAAGLLPLAGTAESPDPLVRQAQAVFGAAHTLPNAFAHTQTELKALCADAFDRCADPVETLLKLR